jgi:hypothetical protein
MDLTHMTYARVAADATPGPMVSRPHDTGVDAFLKDHVTALVKLAAADDSPLARFTDPSARAEFEKLRAGTEQDFLAAAGSLTARLIGQMDGRSAPGLLVCVRFAENGKLSAAALKLQVVTPNAAVLEALDSGEEVLAAATNVLDAPGELQKGAIVPDPRPNSDVAVGDKLAVDAQYFPRAFGIRPEQRAIDAAADLLNALRDQLPPAAVMEIARRLPTLTPGSPKAVLDAAAQVVPELSVEKRSAALDALVAAARPVSRVDTTTPLKEVVFADGITVTGSVESMQAVRIEEKPDGGWQILIDVSEAPRRRFKR